MPKAVISGLFLLINMILEVKCEEFTISSNCSGKVMESQYTYNTMISRGILECAALCDLDYKCLSFQYGDNQCQMNDQMVGSNCSRMVDNPSFQYYQKVCQNGGAVVTSFCLCINSYVGTYCERFMRDCAEGFSSPHEYTTDGIYTIYPVLSPTSFQVYCEMKSNGGRTMFQHHQSSSFYFNRTWQEYKDGFGSLASDHWLGLDKMYYLTNSRNYTAVFYMKLANSTSYHHYFDGFVVENEVEGYQMTFSFAHPHSINTLGDSLTEVKNQYFSTYDNDNDNSSRNCALDMRSGWWYNDCAPCNPNGELLKPSDSLKTTDYEVFWTNDLQNIVPVMVQIWLMV
ncbi:hypothetical protein SNE40_008793 [Patella caerulea]|uniref:Fibrinogen C-terminal domain-containing protein n=1 Tax=Patella caerulea TaxID=87958 RepID=A0AAN8PP73_PATCE